MTQECEEKFYEHLKEASQDPARVCLAGDNTVSEIVQVAYGCLINPNGRLALDGEEYKRIIKEAARICIQHKTLVIKGELITMSMTTTDGKNVCRMNMLDVD